MTVGSIPAQVVIVGQAVTVDVLPFFRDPDGGTLTYAAGSSDDAVLSVSLSGSSLTATGVAPGTATVTVTATDPDGLTAEQSAQVTVEAANHAPEAVGTIDDLRIRIDDVVDTDLAPYFTDPDGDPLAFSAESSAPAVAAAEVSGDTLTITGVSVGEAVITVTAADPGGLTASRTVTVAVRPNQAPETVGTIFDLRIRVDDVEDTDLAAYFTDPDGDSLTFSAESSAPAVAAAEVSGDTLTVTGVSVGEAVITVTAADPGGLTASRTVTVVVRPNQAPEAVGTIDDVQTIVDVSVDTDLAPYFTDPDRDPLTFLAESSAPAVAAAEVSGDTLTITGVSLGEAVITVTAADPGGLTASLPVSVSVLQNRAPEVVVSLFDETVKVDASIERPLAPHFTDPDGDPLTFSAESSAPAVATVAVSGDMITITGISVGAAIITVTAADPAGLTASEPMRVTVEEAQPISFRDDFDTFASIERDWNVQEGVTAAVTDGVLSLTVDPTALAPSGVDTSIGLVSNWQLRARMGRADENTFNVLMIITGDQRYLGYRLDVGTGLSVDDRSDTNYRFWVFDAQACDDAGPACFLPLGDDIGYGNSDAISDGPGEFTEITIALSPAGRLEVQAGTTTLFTVGELDEAYPRSLQRVALWTWPAAGTVTTLWDWIEIAGSQDDFDRVGGPGGPGVLGRRR